MKKSYNLDNMRHSIAHLLAAAVMELYPKTKRAIGPAIENGFYYDFDFAEPISEEELDKIEKKMHQILKSWKSFEREDVPVKDALKREKGNPYKIELIKEFGRKAKTVSYYTAGKFADLCRGGHVNPKEIGPFKLTHLAGAYWRGSEKNKMLTRVYGVAFKTQKELESYLVKQEEAKKRDHRKLGRELDIFTQSEIVGPGLPLLTEKGTLMVNLMMDLVRTLQEPLGYKEVRTPHLTKIELYKISGHYEKFPDLFKIKSKEKDTLGLKPVNCPHHIELYARKLHSWRDLPVRYAEFSTLYRDELSGTLGGLTRVRALTQDDAHVFCAEEQIEREFDRIFSLVKKLMGVYGMKYRLVFSTHDPKQMKRYLGDAKIWKRSEDLLGKIIRKHKIKHEVAPGEAAIYGPKLDLLAEDSLGREWQLSTIQLDLNMPARFGIKYIDKDGKGKTPYLIHRALHGTFERFLGVIIEHYAGAFPLWLAPTQVQIIPVSDKFLPYAKKVGGELASLGLRVEVDTSNETVGKKIRAAEVAKVPYSLVLGQKEKTSGKVAVRKRGKGDIGLMTLSKFEQLIYSGL